MRDYCKNQNQNQKQKRVSLSLCLCPPSVSFSLFPSLCPYFASLCFCNSIALVPTLKLPFGMPRLSYTRKVWTALLKSCFGSYSAHKSRKLQKRKFQHKIILYHDSHLFIQLFHVSFQFLMNSFINSFTIVEILLEDSKRYVLGKDLNQQEYNMACWGELLNSEQSLEASSIQYRTVYLLKPGRQL